ncbi:uncharacterized protein AMSG_10387 [Thecamonas trahens ATCC 50062]|uniref:Uncharacterized protein n=1 Tax=Thecamonas trahens ATCC 50062 TaxID=461836 RepID=A0A0L0DQF3_THETB|nr:hypothetical protein AMSG_10387 [Thecamonas trahens ATCC 50062]KNC54539.1 hypothetical protein AMSG_10387 [Thecamonas trahens ATCC 50062]|eukprot:XP_013753555.1 hypothetical protein AMSG_10387 [Thecamonas trahens ATCC 50062]
MAGLLDGFNLDSHAYVNVDQYLSDHNFQSQVRRNLGSKNSEEILKRVTFLVSERQKETPNAAAS